MKKYKVLDIFAGAGGLSLGFEQTGRFEIVAAIESNESAKNTFMANHKGAVLYDNVLDIDFPMLQEKHGPFNVIIGGPPCQGFSNANRQHNQLINMNNKLIRTYVKFVDYFQPQAFLLENVKMLESETHRFFLTKDDIDEVTAFPSCKTESILIYDGTFSFPFSSYFDCANNIVVSPCISKNITLPNIKKLRRDLIKNSEKFLFKSLQMLLEEVETYQLSIVNPIIQERLSDLIVLCSHELENYKNTDFSNFKKLLSIIEALIKIEDIDTNEVLIDQVIVDGDSISIHVKSFTVIDFLHHQLGKKYSFDKKVLNAADYGVPQNRKRYIMVGILQELNISYSLPSEKVKKKYYTTVSDAISDLKSLQPSYSTEDQAILLQDCYVADKLTSLRDDKFIYNHVITKTSPLALKRFAIIKPGENFHSLDKSMIENYSNPSRTQNSIYLRLDENKPCPTVTNVRKAMWIHPTIDRAISVREAARLQSFPDSFIFKGTKDQQYQQVGNAVPPLLAFELAKSLVSYLDKTSSMVHVNPGKADSTGKK